MIYLYTGTPGSGKSLHVAQDIYFYLNRGKNIIANFDINYDLITGKKRGYFFYRDNFEITPKWLIDFGILAHKRDAVGKIIEGQTWIVIDECQLIFNARSWNDRQRMEWCSFYTQHRKYGYHVILITQFDRLIDRQIRSLVEYEYKHRKVNNFGTLGFLLGIFGSPLFCSIEYWYGAKERIGSNFYFGRKKYYRLYDSYKLFDAVI